MGRPGDMPDAPRRGSDLSSRLLVAPMSAEDVGRGGKAGAGELFELLGRVAPATRRPSRPSTDRPAANSSRRRAGSCRRGRRSRRAPGRLCAGLEKAADFDPARGSALAWMATIARNRALDEVRRVRPVSLEDMPEGFEPAADTVDPLAAREKSEGLKALSPALQAG